jgi:pimeloyl-ACP methyl ester carboxylesterase
MPLKHGGNAVKSDVQNIGAWAQLSGLFSQTIEAIARPGIAASSSSSYRAAYASADQVHELVEKKLEIPVLAVAGEKGIGANHEALVRAFSTKIVESIIVPGAGHFVPEERPVELTMAFKTFLGR